MASEWRHGDTVKIGYMSLIVDRRIPTPGDGKPDKWLVHSLDGTRDYEFQPYSGLRLVADRRPKVPLKVKQAIAARRVGPVESAKPMPASTVDRRLVKATADKGVGRNGQLVDRIGTHELGARLDRLEALLERLGPAIEGAVLKDKRRA